MTVMPSSSDVADKAVSTEDASSGVEVARLEAVLAALVETKVEAIKAASTSVGARRVGSAPSSPRRPRLTSSSTVSSSHNHHHHYHHHHHHRQDRADKKSHHGHRHRRHGSAPCGDYIEDPVTLHRKQRHGKGKQRVPDSPRNGKKRRRHSRSPHGLARDINPAAAIGPRLELLGVDAEQDLAFFNYERTREALNDNSDYPGLHQSACYISHSAAQLRSHYDDDYLAFNYADEFEDEETFSGPAAAVTGGLGAPPVRQGSLEHFHRHQEHQRHHQHHRPRKKRKRRGRRKPALVDVEDPELEIEVDPDELPPQARWTIVATACLLLAMSLLLVGVTLRMAPIIDEMGDGRRASVCKKSRPRRPSSAHRRDSVRPTGRQDGGSRSPSGLLTPTSLEGAIKDPREAEQARRHRRIAMVLLGTFIFILSASVLAVIVTLTHSSFHRPPVGSRELAEHRANNDVIVENKTEFRKENEELLNSLNRDSSIPENTTSSLPP